MDIEVRPIEQDERQRFRQAVAHGFGADSREEDHDRFYEIMELKRTIAAFDGDEIVGTAGDFPFRLTVPGGESAMAGTTVVTVRPTHRRRGILRSMMQLHVESAAERGEPLAGLWSSEAPIYGRFGFGPAVDGMKLEIDARLASIESPDEELVIDIIDDVRARTLLPEVYDSARQKVPGMLSRSGRWWESRWLYDPEHRRGGQSARRYAIALRGGRCVGYVAYRQKAGEWEGSLPDGLVSITELIATDDSSRHALWHFLLHIDLYPHVKWWNAPIDDPIVWWVANRRHVKRAIGDTLWLRLIDVPRALAGRDYEGDGRILLEVRDETLPQNAGTLSLAVEAGAAEVRETGAAPDVRLDVKELGALYLGGRRATELARAGLVDGPPEKVALLDRLMRTEAPPWCPEVF